MGVKFPKRENPFAKYFSKESPIATTQFEEPKMDNYFSSEDVLGRPTAKNTAQRGVSQSEQMKAAYDALMNPKVMSLLQKESAASDDGGDKYLPNRRVFAGAYYDTTPKGELKTETWNISDKMNRGVLKEMIPFGGGGFGTSQTSTTNIAPTGYKPMTMEQASGAFQAKYGTTGTEDQYREFARGSYENIPVEMVNPTLAAQKKAEAEAQKKTNQPQAPLADERKSASSFTTFQGKPFMMGEKPLKDVLLNMQ
jgi:hypothetical protein